MDEKCRFPRADEGVGLKKEHDYMQRRTMLILKSYIT